MEENSVSLTVLSVAHKWSLRSTLVFLDLKKKTTKNSVISHYTSKSVFGNYTWLSAEDSDLQK